MQGTASVPASGEWRWIYTSSKSIANDAGEWPLRVIGTVQDVTARVETEHQLRRAKAEADAASRAKSEFLASMSHEIRTPMNGIIGMTSLITETELNEEQRDFVNTIRASSEALMTIVVQHPRFFQDRVRQRWKSGAMPLRLLALCLEETLDLFAKPAAEKGLSSVILSRRRRPPGSPSDVTRLSADRHHELINNAIKFTSGRRDFDRSAPARRGAAPLGPPLPGVHDFGTPESASRPSR